MGQLLQTETRKVKSFENIQVILKSRNLDFDKFQNKVTEKMGASKDPIKTVNPDGLDKDAKKDETTEAPEAIGKESTVVTVHPLVLLSVVDHFNRMSKIGNQKRVVGFFWVHGLPRTNWTYQIHLRFLLMKMKKTLLFGTLITNTLSKCMPCSRRSTLKRESLDGITQVPNCIQTMSPSMI